MQELGPATERQIKLFGPQKLREIPFRVDKSFGIYVAFIFVAGLLSNGFITTLHHLAVLAAVYALVVLHEYGHCWAAIRCGLHVSSVTVWIFGGIARIEGFGRTPPKEELFIAAAGPAVNAILAGLGASLWLLGLDHVVLTYFVKINVVLCLFNLIPAYPLDGGHILKSGLSLVIAPETALFISARVGQVFAIALGIAAAIAGYYFTAAIALFIFFACKNTIKNGQEELL